MRAPKAPAPGACRSTHGRSRFASPWVANVQSRRAWDGGPIWPPPVEERDRPGPDADWQKRPGCRGRTRKTDGCHSRPRRVPLASR
eukprot:1254806-Lingulodinium_polyedra.AAC.1